MQKLTQEEINTILAYCMPFDWRDLFDFMLEQLNRKQINTILKQAKTIKGKNYE